MEKWVHVENVVKVEEEDEKNQKKREEESMGPIQPRIGRLTQTTN